MVIVLAGFQRALDTPASISTYVYASALSSWKLLMQALTTTAHKDDSKTTTAIKRKVYMVVL